MRFATPREYDRDGWGEPTVSIVVMGLALAIAGLVQTLAIPAAAPVLALELFVSLLVPTGLATGGYWLAGHSVSPDVRWRVATWVSIGVVAACALGGWLLLYVTLEGGTVAGPLSLVTTRAAVGGATGFLAAIQATPRSESNDLVAASGTATESQTAGERTLESTAVEGVGDEVDTDEGGTATAAAADTAASDIAASDTAADNATTADTAAADAATADAAATSSSMTAPNPVSTRLTAANGSATGAIDLGPSGTPAEQTVPGATDSTAFRPTPDPAPGAETVASVPGTAETVLEILRNERARVTLAVLYHDRSGEAQSVDELARVVAEHTDASAEATAVSLRHSTLPRLGDIRAVDWDPRTDRVTASEHAVFEEGVREASVLLESFAPGTR